MQSERMSTYETHQSPDPGSQLCQEESWERVYYPPEPEHLKLPLSLSYHRALCNTFKDKLHAGYCEMKERCTARYALCKLTGRGCKCSSIYHNYFFWSKAVVLVLLMNALFSTALYGIAIKILQYVFGPNYSLMPVVITSATAQVLFPIIGHISDTSLRKHSVLRFSVWCAWISFAILGVAFSIESYSSSFNTMNRYAILPFVFVLLSIAYVCFLSNIIPFALDQLQGASHVHYSSFFYWWYWTLNVGVALVHTPEYCSDKLELRILIHVEVGLVCITAILILDTLLKHWFVIEPHCSEPANPILQMCRVLRYAIRPPVNQRIPSVVHHELDLSSPNRLELAKKRFGGKFETEQVEDTRTFLYVGLMLMTIGFLLVSYFGVFGTITLMKSHFNTDMRTIVISHDTCGLQVSMHSLVRPSVLLLLLPILDLLLVPLLRHIMLHPSILKRLGVGTLCTLLSVLSLLTLEGVRDQVLTAETGGRCVLTEQVETDEDSGMSSYWLILPAFVITLAEIFIYIPGFELICAQAPYNMRSFLLGIFFSVQGLASLIALLLQYLFAKIPVKQNVPFQALHGYTCVFWFYLCLSILAVMAVGLYTVMACKYKKRKRDDIFNHVGMLEEYFSTGRIHSSRWT